MDLEILILSEVSQKDKYHIFYDVKAKKMKELYLQNRNRLTDFETNLRRRKGGGGRIN